jgi:hypothetical protein
MSEGLFLFSLMPQSATSPIAGEIMCRRKARVPGVCAKFLCGISRAEAEPSTTPAASDATVVMRRINRAFTQGLVTKSEAVFSH